MKVLLKTIPSLAKAFSNGSFVRYISLLYAFWFFAVTRKTILRGKPKQFKLSFLGKDFEITIESIVDLAALREAFVEEEYAWSPIEDPKVIIDLGAHFGDTSIYYHLKYPYANILAVEPAPDTFQRLKRNVEHIEQIIPIEAGISDTDGHMDLGINPSSLGHSFNKRKDTIDSVKVPVLTLDTLFQKYNIEKADIIKFDIEGGEEKMFNGVDPSKYSNAYIGEVHEDLISLNVDEFSDLFEDFDVQKEALSIKGRYILKAVTK